MGGAYFSVNILCCTCSAPAKNSSISSAVGMLRSAAGWVLRPDAVRRRVVEPGVPATSESLIKLQGVVSLTFLQRRHKLHPP